MNRDRTPWPLLTAGLTPVAAAQICTPQWLPAGGAPGVIGIQAAADGCFAITPWDPDGGGPQPELLAVGGAFDAAGSVMTRGVAFWHGSGWTSPGGGVTGHVNAIAAHDGDLIAGGSFTAAGGAPVSNIARWDGSAWHALGLGVQGTVGSLIPFAGDLIAGGAILATGGQPANMVARWDGAAWHPMGAGPGQASSFTGVEALAVHQGSLVAGGSFTNPGGTTFRCIARWDGSEWTPLGGGTNHRVSSLVLFEGDLIAAGAFTLAGGVPARRVARWNGAAWSALGSGLGVSASQFASEDVEALPVYNGALYATGYFQTAGSSARTVARWDGVSWQVLPGRFDSTTEDPVGLTLGVYGTELIAGGRFAAAGSVLTTGAGTVALNLARWDGAQWGSLGNGFNEPVWRLAVHEEQLIVGGNFLSSPGGSATRMARWDGASWSAMGTQATHNPRAIVSFQGQLTAAGFFRQGVGTPGYYVARWDGAAWQPFSEFTPGNIGAMVEFAGDLVVAGSLYDPPTGGDLGRVARWTGLTWEPLGAGVGSAAGSGPYNEWYWVNALHVHDGDLIAGGFFTLAGGAPANRIARWDGGAWHALGAGLGGPNTPFVAALASHQGDLIVGGYFTSAGGTPAAGIARWDGDLWHPLGIGIPTMVVEALASYSGELFAGGTDGGWRWNGSAWLGLGLTTGTFGAGHIRGLGVYAGDLVIGGNFFGGGGYISPFFARWRACSPCYPDCNANTQLTIADFACFQSRFAAADPYADCNQSGFLTIADFTCFQTKFAAGCP